MFSDFRESIIIDSGVYAPQDDSQLLADILAQSELAPGSHVLDLCTGSGVLAVTAARLGAAKVTAFDICPRAVRCTRSNANAAEVVVDVRLGSLVQAVACGPYDVVVSNPPYVPVTPKSGSESIPTAAGPARAWDAGDDGRLVLDPLCASAPELLTDGGSMLIVQSEFSGVDESLSALRASGLRSEIIATQTIPFGPVMTARAEWLEATGQLRAGRRVEELIVIRADKP